MWKAEQNGKGHKCHRRCESEAEAELQDFPSKVSSKSSAKYTEPWGRRSAWTRSSQHWSAWLNSSSRSWSQWQIPLIKIPAVPASQTARQQRLKLPFLASQEPLIWGSYNKMVYSSQLAHLTYHSASQCFLEHCASWKAKKSKKDGAANTAKKN